MARHGERQFPVGAGRPTGKQLSSEKALEGRCEQGLAPDHVSKTTKGEYKTGLLVVLATVKGFEKPWYIFC